MMESTRELRGYLCGPIDSFGDRKKNIAAFNEAAHSWRSRGWIIYNPVEGSGTRNGVGGREFIQRANLHRLVAPSGAVGTGLYFDALIVLPGWEYSRGARLEVEIALEVGLPIIDVCNRPVSAAREILVETVHQNDDVGRVADGCAGVASGCAGVPPARIANEKTNTYVTNTQIHNIKTASLVEAAEGAAGGCAGVPPARNIQNEIETDYTLLPLFALRRVAQLRMAAAKHWGRDTWLQICAADHVAHAICHLMDYLSGKDCDGKDAIEHLDHAALRSLMAAEQDFAGRSVLDEMEESQ